MKNYALLKLLHGRCNSLGVSEIRFRYPLKTGREIELHSQAVRAITQHPFQLRIDWSLVNESNYEAFLQACTTISGEHQEPITIPLDVMHGSIAFATYRRFDGQKMGMKEDLVQRIVETGIKPSENALDFHYRYLTREVEVLTGRRDLERLAREERSAFASNLSFYTEE